MLGLTHEDARVATTLCVRLFPDLPRKGEEMRRIAAVVALVAPLPVYLASITLPFFAQAASRRFWWAPSRRIEIDTDDILSCPVRTLAWAKYDDFAPPILLASLPQTHTDTEMPADSYY